MNRKSRIILGITAILTFLAAAYTLATTRYGAETMDHLTPAIAHTDPVVSDKATRALQDMQKLARREFSEFHVQPGSLGSTALYSDDHLLHWITIEHHGHEIYLYHLTENEHPELRHTAMWSSHEPFATPWEPVR